VSSRLFIKRNPRKFAPIADPAGQHPCFSESHLRDYKNLLEVAGLPDIRFRDLRYTAASLMLNHGIPVIIVSRRLGHAKPSITLDIYGHLIPGM
jgi:integrase